MKTSFEMVELLKRLEAPGGRFEPKAYLCPAGVLTIGYGHTGPDVRVGQIINEEQATELLLKDISVAEDAVNKATVSARLTQRQFDALVSFTYNCGSARLRSSTLLKKVIGNPNNANGIAAEFAKWRLAGGKPLLGLMRRRVVEASWYSYGDGYSKFLTIMANRMYPNDAVAIMNKWKV